MSAAEGPPDATPAALRARLERGGILAVPTESSYALAADPRSAMGVAAVFRIKRRPSGEPLPVVLGELGHAADLGLALDDPGLRAVAPLWPAPISVVVPLRTPCPASAGRRSLAVRVPANDRLLALLRRLGMPLTATSANRSGTPPVTRPELLPALLGDEDAALIDGGPLPGGPPSTLVRWSGSGFDLLREGRYPSERLSRQTGMPIQRRPN